MSKKKIAAIICAALGAVGMLGLLKEFSASLLSGSLVLIAIGVALFLWDRFSSKKEKTVEPAQRPTPAVFQVERAPSQLELISGDQVLRYSYMCSLATPIASAARGLAGSAVDVFGADVMLQGAKIGTLADEKQIEMVSDYARHGETVKAFVRSVSEDAVVIELGFYKSAATLKTKDYKVGGGKKYEEDRFTCSVGDLVTISEDTESDKLLVESSGTVIGTLSASVANSLNMNHVIAGKIVALDDDECVVRLYI